MKNNKNRFGLQETVKYFLRSKEKKFPEIIFSSIPEIFFDEFVVLASKICEIEALTFKSEENKGHLNSLNLKIKPYIYSLNDSLKNSLYFIDEQEWRIVIGLYCCFMEWCDDVCFFDLAPEEQSFLEPESPLASFEIFFNN